MTGGLFILTIILLGALLGTGVLLLVLGVQKVEVRPRERTTLNQDLRRLSAKLGRRIPVALGVGLLLLVVTGWPVLAISAGLLVFFWDQLFGGAASERQAYARLEGLAAWTESLRDTIAGAVGLEQAIPATAEAASPAIKAAVQELADHLRVRMPLPQALYRLADELDDPAADLVVAALLLNARLRGPGLRDVLGSLSHSVRAELEMRGRVMAGRSATRRSVQIVVAVSAVFIIGLRLFNPDYVQPYSTATGQVVLLFVAAMFAAGFFWLRRLSAFEKPQRFLASATEYREARLAEQQRAATGNRSLTGQTR